jgi:hypothetical protein
MIDSTMKAANPQPMQLQRKVAFSIVLLILALQVRSNLFVIARVWSKPFSEARVTSEWLQQHGLSANPLVIEPDIVGPSILGYLQKPTAYYPSCQCFGSFIVWNKSRDVQRFATPENLRIARSDSPLPVILIARNSISAERQTQLHVKELASFTNGSDTFEQEYHVYSQQ